MTLRYLAFMLPGTVVSAYCGSRMSHAMDVDDWVVALFWVGTVLFAQAPLWSFLGGRLKTLEHELKKLREESREEYSDWEPVNVSPPAAP